jgi:hypothetical protein
MKIILQKCIYILLIILNIVLIYDIPLFKIFREHYSLIQSINNFLYNSDFIDNMSDNEYTFFLTSIALKVGLLLLLVYSVIRDKNNLFFHILITCILFVYGLSFTYEYVIEDFMLFRLSALIKYTTICISVIILYNHLKRCEVKRQFHSFFSKKNYLILTLILSFPSILFETLHVTGRVRISDKEIEKAIQAAVDCHIRKDSCDIIFINSKAMLNTRSVFCYSIKEIETSFFEKAYMYSQINTDKIRTWDISYISNVMQYDYTLKSYYNHKLKYTPPYIYYFTKPIFNFRNNLAYIGVVGKFIHEPWQYTKFEKIFLEKKHNRWQFKKIIKWGSGLFGSDEKIKTIITRDENGKIHKTNIVDK